MALISLWFRLINFANSTIWMHIHTQIISFDHLLNAISCSWCKYLLQSLFEIQFIISVILYFVFLSFLSFYLFIILFSVVHSFCLSVSLSPCLFCLSLFLSFCLSVLVNFCWFLLIWVHFSSWEAVLVLPESLCTFLGGGEQKVANGWLS